MKRCHAIYSFYLHSFTFLTISLETYNNIDLKTKGLFTLSEKFQSFESRNENIDFLRKNHKINKRGRPCNSGAVGNFFESKIIGGRGEEEDGRGFIRDLRVHVPS